MESIQKKEAEETAALENMVLQVEANLQTTTVILCCISVAEQLINTFKSILSFNYTNDYFMCVVKCVEYVTICANVI